MENNKIDQVADSATTTTPDDYSSATEEPTLILNISPLAEQDNSKAGETANFGPSISKSLRQLIEEMHMLRQDFDTKIKYDESKERQVDSLHRELQTYREGLHFKILRPLFIDLIAVHDDLGKLIESTPNEEPHSAVAQSIKNLASFQETIEEILRRNGVEAFCLEGNIYNTAKQRALQAQETTDPTLDKQIARRVRKGFEYEGRLLRPELVVTYKAVADK